MTITHLDDEPLDELHPLDLLERAVEANGWAFERAGRDELNLSVAGKWSDHHFNFSWREDLQSLHLSSAFDMRISEGVRRQNVADLDAIGRRRSRCADGHRRCRGSRRHR